jgi:hypothetical protein
MKNKYYRIGPEFYKSVEVPGIYGEKNLKIIKWNRQTIIDDHGKDFLEGIKKYDGFTVVPSHKEYQQVIGDFYNKYHPLTHKVLPHNLSKIEVTLSFLAHVFGEQLEIGLDYLGILWHQPTHILPILCLVSEERSTGKTTFLNWLKSIFEDNMTLNNNEDLRSRFNSDWTNKLIVAEDEVLLDKKEDSERLKNLSTAKNYKTESKGKDKIETQFFGKFILCSNNESNFILIDENEIRYWVRKVPKLENSNPKLFEKLKDEIPYFIDLLEKRKISSPNKTRMWFTRDQIATEALKKLVKGTKLSIEKELIFLLEEMFDDYETEEICLSFNDLSEIFNKSRVRITRKDVRRIVLDKWNITPENSSYKMYYKTLKPGSGEWEVEFENKKGRFYRFNRDLIKTV